MSPHRGAAHQMEKSIGPKVVQQHGEAYFRHQESHAAKGTQDQGQCFRGSSPFQGLTSGEPPSSINE